MGGHLRVGGDPQNVSLTTLKSRLPQTHHDQIRHQEHPGADGAPCQPADGLRQSHVPPGCVTPPHNSRGSPLFGEGSHPWGSPFLIKARGCGCLCVCAGEGKQGLLLPRGLARCWGKPRPSGTPQNPPGPPKPSGALRLFPPFLPFPPLPFPGPRLVRAGANHLLSALEDPISSAEVWRVGADWVAEVPAHQTRREGAVVGGG